MNVGEHGKPIDRLHFREHIHGLRQTNAARRLRRSAIGLIEGRFENEPNAKLAAHLFQGTCHKECVIAALHRTWPRNQRERQFLREHNIANRDLSVSLGHRIFIPG